MVIDNFFMQFGLYKDKRKVKDKLLFLKDVNLESGVALLFLQNKQGLVLLLALPFCIWREVVIIASQGSEEWGQHGHLM